MYTLSVFTSRIYGHLRSGHFAFFDVDLIDYAIERSGDDIHIVLGHQGLQVLLERFIVVLCFQVLNFRSNFLFPQFFLLLINSLYQSEP